MLLEWCRLGDGYPHMLNLLAVSGFTTTFGDAWKTIPFEL